ncbi:hypothetical protein Hanom_Chr02g00101061 [Helianthus anomalus]
MYVIMLENLNLQIHAMTSLSSLFQLLISYIWFDFWKQSLRLRSHGGSTSNRGARSGTGRYAGRRSRWGTFTNIRIINNLLKGRLALKPFKFPWRNV